jgi:hypothetical protein
VSGLAVLALLALVVTAGGTHASPGNGSASASPISRTERVRATRGGDSSCATSTVALACRVQVTPDGSAYDYAVPSPGRVTVTAPTTSGKNNREFFWSSISPVQSDASACATFYGEGVSSQPGIALRIRQAPNPNRIIGITVIQNYLFYVHNVFDFDVWDSSKPVAFTLFGQTTIQPLPPHPPFPLHMCARVSGTTVQFVVWENGMTRPPWGDRVWGGQAELPAGAPTSGQTGFYIGHVRPGSSTTLSGLTVDGTRENPVP